jgi:hypothetical protein
MKKNALKSGGGDSGNHAPAPEYAEKVTQMNPLNSKVKETTAKLKEFKGQSKTNYSNLPELGPYRYSNGATYQGQYQSGLRTGYGKQVIIIFRKNVKIKICLGLARWISI